MSPPLPLPSPPTPSPLSTSFLSFSSQLAVTRFSCLLQFSFHRPENVWQWHPHIRLLLISTWRKAFYVHKIVLSLFFFFFSSSSFGKRIKVTRARAGTHSFRSFHLMKFFYVVKFATFSVPNEWREKTLCPCLRFPGTCQHILCFCIHKSCRAKVRYNALPFRRNEIECGADGFFARSSLSFYRVVTRVQRYATNDISASNSEETQTGDSRRYAPRKPFNIFPWTEYLLGKCEAECRRTEFDRSPRHSSKCTHHTKHTYWRRKVNARPNGGNNKNTVSLTNVCLSPPQNEKKKSKSFKRLFYNRKFVRILRRLCPYQFNWMKGNNKKNTNFYVYANNSIDLFGPVYPTKRRQATPDVFRHNTCLALSSLASPQACVVAFFFLSLCVYVFISFIKLEHTHELSVCRRVDSNFFSSMVMRARGKLEPFLRSLTIYFDMSNWLSPIN